MPWIDKEICTGCEICIDECPVDTIYRIGSVAEIHMDNCIRCAICHDVCALEAVRHDSEKTEEWIEANVQIAKRNRAACERYLGSEKGEECFKRTIKHFIREQKIAEETVKRLQALINN